tara:strand:+ start:12099 stop:13214 length:1116 start_codon:yes stop_codon:yes gene_type:complete
LGTGLFYVILDHISASWATDETLSINESGRVTVQWSLIADSVGIGPNPPPKNGKVSKPFDHAIGTPLRGRLETAQVRSRHSFHHNVWHNHNNGWTPRVGSSGSYLSITQTGIPDPGTPAGPIFDIRFNFISQSGNAPAYNADFYKWDDDWSYMAAPARYNLVGNYFDDAEFYFRESSAFGWGHFAGNDGAQGPSLDYIVGNWKAPDFTKDEIGHKKDSRDRGDTRKFGVPMSPASFFQNLDSPEQIAALFDYLPRVYLFIKDAESRFVKVNQGFLILHGFQDECEVVGKTDFDFHPPALASQYVDEDRRVMKSGEPLPDQVWLVLGFDGLPRWFLSTKIPLFDRNHDVAGLCGVMRPYEHAGVSLRVTTIA